MRPSNGPTSRPRATLTYRQARLADLGACARIWSDAIEDYVARLNQPWFSGDLAPLERLLAHFVRTDPTRFCVVTNGDADDAEVVGFGSATVRGNVWFLGMLFVLPGYQGSGVGRTLLERVLPAGARRFVDPSIATAGRLTLSTATDSVQPISNGLYSQYGLTPQLPVFNFVGRPEHTDALGALPAGVSLRESVPGTRAADLAAMAVVDRSALGYEHAADHEFQFAEGRRTFLAQSERGDILGYGTIAPSGRFGPIAAITSALLAPITGELLRAVRAPGAYASWIPGSAQAVFVGLLAAGFRFESFPTLLLWDRTFADFSRYVPINLALL